MLMGQATQSIDGWRSQVQQRHGKGLQGKGLAALRRLLRGDTNTFYPCSIRPGRLIPATYYGAISHTTPQPDTPQPLPPELVVPKISPAASRARPPTGHEPSLPPVKSYRSASSQPPPDGVSLNTEPWPCVPSAHVVP